MSLRQLLHKPVSAWHVICLMALGVAARFGVISCDPTGMRDEVRSCLAVSIGKELIDTMNSTNLDGITKEFTADLASFLDPYPWAPELYPYVHVGQPRREDRRGCVRVILTNDVGHALDLLLQDEHARGDVRFRLLSYRKITQPGASPNGGPTPSVGDSGASGGRHR